MKIPGAHEGNRNCGGTAGYKDELVVVSFEIPHFAEDLEILFEDNLN